MSCCGNDKTPSAKRAEPPVKVSAFAPRFGRGAILIEYAGPRGLMVRGPCTGKLYRFAGRGARIAVDRRDALRLLVVPNLQRAPAGAG